MPGKSYDDLADFAETTDTAEVSDQEATVVVTAVELARQIVSARRARISSQSDWDDIVTRVEPDLVAKAVNDDEVTDLDLSDELKEALAELTSPIYTSEYGADEDTETAEATATDAAPGMSIEPVHVEVTGGLVEAPEPARGSGGLGRVTVILGALALLLAWTLAIFAAGLVVGMIFQS